MSSPEPFVLDLRAGLRATRRKLGLSQRAAGELVGVSGGALGRWENGNRAISLYQAVGLARGLGVPLLGGIAVAAEKR
jgi:transcriptional regulator with XRE-family HTH domain